MDPLPLVGEQDHAGDVRKLWVSGEWSVTATKHQSLIQRIRNIQPRQNVSVIAEGVQLLEAPLVDLPLLGQAIDQEAPLLLVLGVLGLLALHSLGRLLLGLGVLRHLVEALLPACVSPLLKIPQSLALFGLMGAKCLPLNLKEIVMQDKAHSIPRILMWMHILMSFPVTRQMFNIDLELVLVQGFLHVKEIVCHMC